MCNLPRMRVGLDMCGISRMEEHAQDERFLNRFFTAEEAAYIASKGSMAAQTVAGIFAAKEAFVKALGTGFDGSVSIREIEILHDNNGAPYYNLNGNALLMVKEKAKVKLTISHTETDAIAFCLIED